MRTKLVFVLDVPQDDEHDHPLDVRDDIITLLEGRGFHEIRPTMTSVVEMADIRTSLPEATDGPWAQVRPDQCGTGHQAGGAGDGVR